MAARSSSRVESALERKAGPAPVWLWAVLGGGLLYLWRNRGASGARTAGVLFDFVPDGPPEPDPYEPPVTYVDPIDYGPPPEPFYTEPPYDFGPPPEPGYFGPLPDPPPPPPPPGPPPPPRRQCPPGFTEYNGHCLPD